MNTQQRFREKFTKYGWPELDLTDEVLEFIESEKQILRGELSEKVRGSKVVVVSVTADSDEPLGFNRGMETAALIIESEGE